jgi:hypothetical protein
MGREVRRVPPDWQHPKNANDRFIPLFEGYKIAQWYERKKKWDEGFQPDYHGGWEPKDQRWTEKCMPFEDYAGPEPDPKDYMPAWTAEEATWYQMYECTTEGTPISPAFATPEELARWLTDNEASAFADMTATYEQWLRVCQGGYAPSAVMHDGTITSGVEAMGEVDDA